MKFWPFKKTNEIRWSSLSAAEKRLVARKLAGAVMDLTGRAHGAQTFGRGYEAVTAPYSRQRRPAYIEKSGEDAQTSTGDKFRLINMQRDMMRNSPTRVAQDQQLRVNVVGSVGGKLYASFPTEFKEAADEVMNYFNRKWFPRAEYAFRKDFNWLLKTCLTGADTNGAVILVFDDGVLTGGNGTGRIRGFEGDEIACVSEDRFAKLFGDGHEQREGLVYNSSGMWCGAFVSMRHRGESVFPDDKFITLRFDPFDDTASPNWIMLGDMRRFNQGKPVSPLTAAITCLIDLHETVASEAQAAKINAQLVGQILTDASAETDDGESAAFTDEPGEVSAAPEEVTFDTRELSAIGAHFDQMPPGLKIDLLKTERPNPNMPAYIEFLTGLVGGTRGLGRVYSTLKAQTSYTAFRGEQVMTWPSFEEAQRTLEREVCDWAARHVIERAVKMGLIKATLPEGWQYMLAWRWPKMREVSEKDAETARQLKLKNGMTSLHRELGPGEYERLREERRREAADAREDGVIYQASESAGAKTISPADENEPAADDDDVAGGNNDETEGGDDAE